MGCRQAPGTTWNKENGVLHLLTWPLQDKHTLRVNRSTYLDGIHVTTKVLDFEFGSTQRLGSGVWLSGYSFLVILKTPWPDGRPPSFLLLDILMWSGFFIIMPNKQKTKASGWDPSLTVHAPCMPALNSCCPSWLLIWEWILASWNCLMTVFRHPLTTIFHHPDRGHIGAVPQQASSSS